MAALNTESFVFYESTYKTYEKIKKIAGVEAAARFFEAVSEYGLYGIVPEEDDPVWLNGLEQIFTSIGRAKDRYAAAASNGAKGGRPSKIDYDKAEELKAQGYTYKDIAAKMGCSVSSLEKYFAKKRGKPEKPVITVFTGEEDTTRKNRKNLNDNENFSGFLADARKVGKGVFTANAAKTLSAPENGDWKEEFRF